MSVFRVKLNNNAAGLLDTDSSGNQFSTSHQRTMYVMGPGRTSRKLVDGSTFTDCNYWKRFSYPTVALEDAFIEVVTDDGSNYTDDGDNTFPVVWNPGTAGVIAAGDDEDDTNMSYDVLSTHGAAATFTQITNNDGSDSVQMIINDVATMTLGAGDVQIFNNGDIAITKLAFDNSASGAAEVNSVQVVFGIKTVCNS